MFGDGDSNDSVHEVAKIANVSIQVTDSKNVALYDSVTGRPYGVVFESEDHALDFLDWVAKQTDPSVTARELADVTQSTFEDFHSRWFGERIDVDGFLKDEDDNDEGKNDGRSS